jgi:glutaredoxin-like YruB-family protein
MNVTVYSTPVCPWCSRVKEFLKDNNVEFKEIDVSADQKAAQDMIEKSGQMGVPVVDVDGEIVIGFNESRLRELLKL